MLPHLFIGPTAQGIPSEKLTGFLRHGPIAAGMIDTLRQHTSAPGQIILVDGNLEPGHEISNRELLHALDAGWQIYGLASVGALKAAELHTHGLHGFGLIARYARLFPHRAKNEVAALYFPTPPYQAASEPLIELRLLLRALRQRGYLTRKAESAVATYLTTAPLEERTFESIARRYPAAHTIPPEEWQAKRRDLLTFLKHYTPNPLINPRSTKYRPSPTHPREDSPRL